MGIPNSSMNFFLKVTFSKMGQPLGAWDCKAAGSQKQAAISIRTGNIFNFFLLQNYDSGCLRFLRFPVAVPGKSRQWREGTCAFGAIFKI